LQQGIGSNNFYHEAYHKNIAESKPIASISCLIGFYEVGWDVAPLIKSSRSPRQARTTPGLSNETAGHNMRLL